MILWKQMTPQRMFSKIKTGKFLFSVEDFSSLQTFWVYIFLSNKKSIKNLKLFVWHNSNQLNMVYVEFKKEHITGI